MGKTGWYNPFLTKDEQHGQTSSRAAKARRKMKEYDEKNGTKLSKPAKYVDKDKKSTVSTSNSARNIVRRENANSQREGYGNSRNDSRGYPRSGDKSQKQAAQNENRMVSRKAKPLGQMKKLTPSKNLAINENSRDAIVSGFKQMARSKKRK